MEEEDHATTEETDDEELGLDGSHHNREEEDSSDDDDDDDDDVVVGANEYDESDEEGEDDEEEEVDTEDDQDFDEEAAEFIRAVQPRTLDDLCEYLATRGLARSPHVRAAFMKVDRSAYLPAPCRECAFDDNPLRYPDEAASCLVHLSAPSIYAAALEALDLKPNLSLLNLGSGSGYFSALCAHALGPNAVHHCMERCPNLAQRCRASLAEDPLLKHIKVHAASAFDLDFDNTPMKFDRIYCGAGGTAADARLFAKLLKAGGILVGPFEPVVDESEPSPLSRRGSIAQCLVKVTRSAPPLPEATKEAPMLGLDVEEIMHVNFTVLVRSSKNQPTAQKVVLRGPVWGSDEPELFPPAFRAAVASIARVCNERSHDQAPNSLADKRRNSLSAELLPWHVWETCILSYLSYDDVGPNRPKAKEPHTAEASSLSGGEGVVDGDLCLHCGLNTANSCCDHCKDARFCSRECQRLAWPEHKLICCAPAPNDGAVIMPAHDHGAATTMPGCVTV